MAPLNPRLADLSDDDRLVLESWLVEFDQRWDDGILANRAQQIPPGSSWRLPALAEMVKIDLERQWQRGRQVSLESYLKDFPELGNPGDVSADLIQAEYEVRRQFGAPAALEDYLRRFPHQAGELARLIAQGGSSLARRSSAGVAKPGVNAQELPEQFGRYRILKRLGQGGMGSVHLAEDTQLQRRVALKVATFGTKDGSEPRKRLLAEARAAATLDHPYLCPVHDVGEIDGRLYLTMAYIEGQSLAESTRGKSLPPRSVAALVGKLAVALQEAHAKGVIHRDLKPSNVMIKSTGPRREPVIVDFGLARREDANEGRLTKTGQVMGTLDYMAPEQLRGELKEIGPACDIYALGVILYELLTGRLPFEGSGLAVVGQILTQAPLPPSTFRPDLDPRLEAICLKAMAKTVGDRFTTMADLAAALTDYLRAPAGASTPSPSAPAPAPAGQSSPPAGSDTLVARLLDRVVTNPGQASLPPEALPPALANQPDYQIKRELGRGGMGVVYLAHNTLMGRDEVLKVMGRQIMDSPDLLERFLREIRAVAKLRHPSIVTAYSATRLGESIVFAMEYVKGLDLAKMVQAKGPLPVGHACNFVYQAALGLQHAHEEGLVHRDIKPGNLMLSRNKLSKREGLRPYYESGGEAQPGGEGYRLPTEAEWEYACWAGSKTRFSFGDDAVRLGEFAWWYGDKSGFKTHPVGQKPPNAWGLYDMHGNVLEWCEDWYHEGYYRQAPGDDPVGPPRATARVCRGGGWHSGIRHCRSAARIWYVPESLDMVVGFRVARTQ